ncbi:hypothetical protein HYS94_03720 [Candidatus Daviesbacteria bacterium]|nr:hypothetical protein [Candidatus Daviesbacteria bacterium]
MGAVLRFSAKGGGSQNFPDCGFELRTSIWQAVRSFAKQKVINPPGGALQKIYEK